MHKTSNKPTKLFQLMALTIARLPMDTLTASNSNLTIFIFYNTGTGAAPREGLGGTVPSLLKKVIFVNCLKPTGSNLYFIQLLTNFILLNLIFCHLNSCAMPLGLCVIKLELIKFTGLPL